MKGACGLMDAALATGSLDLGALSSLLPALGLAHQPAEHQALWDALGIPDGAVISTVSFLPWPGPPRRVGNHLCVDGPVGLHDACLRLSAGSALGRMGLKVSVSVPPADGAGELPNLLRRMGGSGTPMTLVVGQPRLTLDLVSPAMRDLHPVLEVAAERAGLPRPALSSDAAYEWLPVVESMEAAIRDERALNDVAAGIHRTAHGAVMALPAVDADAADARLGAALKAGEGILLCVQPQVLRPLLPFVSGRLRAALVLAEGQVAAGVQAELPDRVVDATHGCSMGGLLGEAAVQSRDIELDGEVKVGETALAAPGLLLRDVARRTWDLPQAAVIDGTYADAVFALEAAKDAGALTGRCRTSVAVYSANTPRTGRALACAFLQQNLKEGRAAGRSQKVRIRG